MERSVRIARSGNRVATIRIDRPKVNAIHVGLAAELIESATNLAQDQDVGAVVLWGGPNVFSAGADIGNFDSLGPATFQELASHFNRCFAAVENLPQVTIAAINGAALGGGLELAMATDFRVASTDALLGHPEIHLGLVPGGGAMHRLMSLVGTTKAKEMIYGGESVDADTALRIGLASEVCAPDETYATAVEMAARYSSGPAALRIAKQALREVSTLPLSEAAERQVDHLVRSLSTDDAAIGISSFLRHGPGKALFTGR